MACCRRSLLFTPRTLATRALSTSIPRLFPAASSSSASSSSSPTSPTSNPPISSCPPGTKLLPSFLKDKPDTLSLEDSEYPAWLWSLASPSAVTTFGGGSGGGGKGAAGKAKKEVEVGSREMTQKLRKEGKKAIKAANTLKGR